MELWTAVPLAPCSALGGRGWEDGEIVHGAGVVGRSQWIWGKNRELLRNSWRFVLDLRVLNKCIPLLAPIVASYQDLSEKMTSEKNVFSTCDVGNGFWSLSQQGQWK